MVRHALALLICATLGAPTAFAQSNPVRPTATSDVGPWEAVVWTRDNLVHRCTMSRARNAPDGLSYGVLVDREGILLGVAHKTWKFASEAPVQATLAPQAGAERKLTARPVSNLRANIELPKAMLDQLQRSEHADVQIGRFKSPPALRRFQRRAGDAGNLRAEDRQEELAGFAYSICRKRLTAATVRMGELGSGDECASRF